MLYVPGVTSADASNPTGSSENLMLEGNTSDASAGAAAGGGSHQSAPPSLDSLSGTAIDKCAAFTITECASARCCIGVARTEATRIDTTSDSTDDDEGDNEPVPVGQQEQNPGNKTLYDVIQYMVYLYIAVAHAVICLLDSMSTQLLTHRYVSYDVVVYYTTTEAAAEGFDLAVYSGRLHTITTEAPLQTFLERVGCNCAKFQQWNGKMTQLHTHITTFHLPRGDDVEINLDGLPLSMLPSSKPELYLTAGEKAQWDKLSTIMRGMPKRAKFAKQYFNEYQNLVQHCLRAGVTEMPLWVALVLSARIINAKELTIVAPEVRKGQGPTKPEYVCERKLSATEPPVFCASNMILTVVGEPELVAYMRS
eukprot:8323-Heterococcus_DN1.PRE.9